MEYTTKYAAKAPAGSRTLGDTLRDCVEEVCKYTREGEPLDLLRRSLQKFYARTLGERDYSMFEAMTLGLNLPQFYSLLNVESLNTYGTRKLKPAKDLVGAGPEETVEYPSRVDKFDDRLGLIRRQFSKPSQDDERAYWERVVENVSMYEFYWKYKIQGKKIAVASKDVAIMVTPGPL